MSRSPYSVLAADGADRDVGALLHDMHEEVFDGSAPPIAPKEGYWWIAWKGNNPVGFAGLRLSQSTPGTGYLHRAGVLPRHRGNGLQVRFIRLREAMARKLGMSRMVTDTTDNIPSANSLIRAGYRLFTPVQQWAFGDQSLYWEKAL
ncbi:MAG TPA: GNAT family N-acetyltransferase [Xanthobacteraceae bacterium]|nr:GNAT family N-acetyltransferase [Xanthobacteraceae bacterium]